MQIGEPGIRVGERGNRDDGDGTLEEEHVAIDDFIDDFTEHQCDEQVERGEVAHRALAERTNDDEHEEIDGNGARRRKHQLPRVHARRRLHPLFPHVA